MANPSPIDYLISAQHEVGGWGYKTGHRPVVEPTAMVLLALRNEPAAQAAFQRGLTWLLSCQHQDGGWGINEDDPESGWHTAWALICMKAAGQEIGSISRGEQWLVSVATSEISTEAFLRSEIPSNIPTDAQSWPWLPGQAPWVEPTALAVLALKGMKSSSLLDSRLSSAYAYLNKYRTPSGGWSTGNAGPLDTIVIPRAYPTALVLLTLAGVAKRDIQAVDLVALERDLEQEQGMLAHAAGLLTLKILGKATESAKSLLSTSQLINGSWENSPFVTAWAMLAIKGAM